MRRPYRLPGWLDFWTSPWKDDGDQVAVPSAYLAAFVEPVPCTGCTKGEWLDRRLCKWSRNILNRVQKATSNADELVSFDVMKTWAQRAHVQNSAKGSGQRRAMEE